MRNRYHVVPALAVVALSSCTDPDQARRLSELEVKVAVVESGLAHANAEIELLKLANQNEVELDTAEKEYGVARTQQGQFFVSTENVAPFGDGYKVTLRIGNPHNATFSGFRLKVRYGRRRPEWKPGDAGWSERDAEWQKSLRQKDLALTDVLGSGRWNRVSIVLAPAKPDEVGYLGLRMFVDQVQLYGP